IFIDYGCVSSCTTDVKIALTQRRKIAEKSDFRRYAVSAGRVACSATPPYPSPFQQAVGEARNRRRMTLNGLIAADRSEKSGFFPAFRSIRGDYSANDRNNR
ncbi:MAG: hypothetical protein KJZ86_25145, partial [Caldilineaceae bacterium]|nr:hypothetical protein [Caldilineaceae bacterium]